MSDGMEERAEFMRTLEGLSLEAVTEIAWRHFARGIGLIPCEVCPRWFYLEEEGGTTFDSVDFCAEHWAELVEEAADA